MTSGQWSVERAGLATNHSWLASGAAILGLALKAESRYPWGFRASHIPDRQRRIPAITDLSTSMVVKRLLACYVAQFRLAVDL